MSDNVRKQQASYSSFEQKDTTGTVRKSNLAGTLVEIKDYLAGPHALKVVDYKTGKPLMGNASTDSKNTLEKSFEHSPSKSFKTLPAPGAPIMEVTDTEVSIRGSKNDGFFSAKDFGNVVSGPTSFTASMPELRFNGLMTMNPILTTGIPSTMVSPISTFMWSLPSGGMLAPIARDVALMSTLIGIG